MEWIAADVEGDLEEGAIGSIEHEDREANGQWIVRIAFDQFDTAALDTVTVTKTEEGTIRYVDTGIAEWAGEEDVGKLTYQMAMPGEIVETNADRVADDTNTAIWDASDPGSTPEEAFVESEADEGILSGLDLDLGWVSCFSSGSCSSSLEQRSHGELAIRFLDSTETSQLRRLTHLPTHLLAAIAG